MSLDLKGSGVGTVTAVEHIVERIGSTLPQLDAFCQKWQMTELAFFGSILREDFGPESDIDVLVSFADHAGWTLLDLVMMEQELEILWARDVDLIERRVIEASPNGIRRRQILESAQVIYKAVYEPA